MNEIEQTAMWQALEARDARFDGAFVFAVRSTGIYCKPSCPSRRPRREHVTFFPSCDEAERGGYRSCLRCRPKSVAGRDARVDLTLRACRAIDAHDGEAPPSLETLAAALGASPHALHRAFKQVTGVTPRQYAAGRRLERFKARVREGADVTGAMYEAGYGSSSRLYEKASEQLGMTPATYRRGGHGMAIGYTIASSELGRMLVAATDRGVCAVYFGDDDRELSAMLEREYPAAAIDRDEQGLGRWVEAVAELVDGDRPHADLPLDVRATAFQLRVWEELRRIPYGETRTYGEIAEAMGRPTAARAVARACATNPVAVVTPCHRVVGRGGALAGYRWGVARKRALLDREAPR